MRKLLSLLLIMVLLAVVPQMAFADSTWYCPKCGRKNNMSFCPADGTKKPSDLGGGATESTAGARSSVRVGDIVRMGKYEQDNNYGNGQEAIEWVVLEVRQEKALLLSKYGLEARQPYHSQYSSVTWENCTLRKWLNDQFFWSAFTASERDAILETYVDNSASQNIPGVSKSGGNNTWDKMFLLSFSEATKYFPTMEGRRCAPTSYALAQNAWTYNQRTTDGKLAGTWWLRSPGKNLNTAACVDLDGYATFSCSVGNNFSCVRPAMWVSMG